MATATDILILIVRRSRSPDSGRDRGDGPSHRQLVQGGDFRPVRLREAHHD
jgi:hypothetical protein